MSRIVTIGIAGHVDHGKTSLVRSLTGIDTDRMKEEKKRGLSIEFGVAPLVLASGVQVSLVDVPGHTDFMKNTIRGLSAVDAAILVVAADDGVMPQTREHLEILKYLEVASGLVVLSKADLVDQDTLELAAIEVRELTAGTCLENCPILPFSTGDNQGREEILAAIDAMYKISDGTKRDDAPFRMFVDQIRTVHGYGTVASGTVLSGEVRTGDMVEVLPTGKTARVRSVQTHHAVIEKVPAGVRAGINLQGISLNELSRGMVMAAPGSISPARFLNCTLTVSSLRRKGLPSGERIKVYLGTSVTGSLVVPMEVHELEPGEPGLVQLRLAEPVAAKALDRFVITPLNEPEIIGGGRVLETTGLKFRNAHAGRIVPVLNALKKGDPRGFVAAWAHTRPERVMSAAGLSGHTGIPKNLLEQALDVGSASALLVQLKDRTFFSADYFQHLKDLVLASVDGLLAKDPDRDHAGPAYIASSLPHGLDAPVMDSILKDLVQEGKLVAVAGGFTTPAHAQGSTSGLDRMTQQILSFIEAAGISPVTMKQILMHLKQERETRGIKRSMEFLLTRADVVKLGNERFVSRQGLEAIKDRVREWTIDHGCLTPVDCPAVLGYGRTAGVPVIEYLDSVGFTERRGNEHILKSQGDVSRHL